jgi:hypothetical protein
LNRFRSGSIPRSGSARVAMMGAVCLAAGVVAGTLFSSARRHSRETPEAAPQNAGRVPASDPPPVQAPALTVATRLSEADKGALRDLVREELAAERARVAGARDAGRAAAEPDSTEVPISAANVKSFDEARSVIDEGLSRHVWTEADRAHIRQAVARLPPEMRMELIRPLIVAVNSGKVRFDGRGPLF